ncbi:MAG: hypothetical protein WD032_08020 [Nitrospirales bacterium]
MSFTTKAETDSSHPTNTGNTQATYRKVTASQGARSGVYEISHERTQNLIPRKRNLRYPQKAASEFPRTPSSVSCLAEREHVGRLLRDCLSKADALLEAEDPVASALLGTSLSNIMKELWAYRACREEDWIETLNMLQIVLANQVFETFSKEKRIALVRIFQEGLLERTVGRRELERTMRLLTNAGFDIWRGIQSPAEEQSSQSS